MSKANKMFGFADEPAVAKDIAPLQGAHIFNLPLSIVD